MKKEKLTVILKITNNCNLKCPYCYLSDKLNNKKEMTMELFEKSMIKIFTNYKRANIIFHGGEPTIVGTKKLEEMFEKIKNISETLKSSYDLSLQTNLTLINEEMLNLFIKYNVGVGFSYDGYFNDDTRGKDEIIINNFNLFKQKGLNIGCISLLMSDKMKEAYKHELFMSELKIKYRLNTCFETKTGNKLKYNYNDIEETKKFIDFLFDREDTYGLETFKNEIDYAITGKSYSCERINCIGGWISISPEGDIAPCGQIWDWRAEKYIFGNIEDIDLSKYMKEEIYSSFVNKIQSLHDSKCNNCEIFDFCKSGCPAKNYNNNGDVNKIDKNYCNYKKEILKYITLKIKNKDFKNKELIQKTQI